MTGDDDPHPSQETMVVEIAGDLAEPVAAVTGLAQMGTGGRKACDEAGHGATGAEGKATASTQKGQNEPPGQLALGGGFNVTNLAERVGFEPTIGLHL
ncbi:MAG: hypothetical protein ACRENM_04970 [Candidatus Dormibacteraceae bacterium]